MSYTQDNGNTSVFSCHCNKRIASSQSKMRHKHLKWKNISQALQWWTTKMTVRMIIQQVTWDGPAAEHCRQCDASSSSAVIANEQRAGSASYSDWLGGRWRAAPTKTHSLVVDGRIATDVRTHQQLLLASPYAVRRRAVRWLRESCHDASSPPGEKERSWIW